MVEDGVARVGGLYIGGEYIGECEAIIPDISFVESDEKVIKPIMNEFSVTCQIVLSDPFKKSLEKFKEAMNNLSKAMEDMKNIKIKSVIEPIKHKKGKKLKCWENKRFYQ